MHLTLSIKQKPVKVYRLQRELKGDIGKGLKAAAIFYTSQVKRVLKSQSPLRVRTGRLSDSPTWGSVQRSSGGDQYIEAGTNVVYAPVHEFGLRAGRGKGFMMPKRPVWGPTLKKYHNKILQTIRRCALESIRR